MDDAARRTVYVRLTWRKLFSSKVTWGACLALAMITAVFWVRESLETALRALLTLEPYLFLFMTQDMMKGEIDGGTLENVLFIDGGYKKYLMLKNPVAAAAAAIIAVSFFVVFSVPAAVSGALSGRTIIPLQIMALAVGIYYVYLGDTLSLFLKGGSNVMIVIIVQAAVFVTLILTVKAEGGILAYLETGSFPSFGERLRFMGFAALCPPFLMSPRFLPYALEFAGLAAALGLIQSVRIRGLELERR